MNELVKINHGQLATTSLIVAQEFGRRHYDVIREIKRLSKSGAIDKRDFTFISYKDQLNREREAILLNERAFLTAMPFIGGDKSVLGQKRLVDAFLEMRDQLNQKKDAYWQQVRNEGKCIRLGLTSTIQDFVNYATSQGSQNASMYYMSITKMEYKALEFVKKASDKQFRDKLNTVQHTQLSVIELAAQEALRKGMDEGLLYKDCYQMARKACEELADTLKRLTPYNAQIGKAQLAATSQALKNTHQNILSKGM